MVVTVFGGLIALVAFPDKIFGKRSKMLSETIGNTYTKIFDKKAHEKKQQE
jgi:hypothetical protein